MLQADSFTVMEMQRLNKLMGERLQSLGPSAGLLGCGPHVNVLNESAEPVHRLMRVIASLDSPGPEPFRPQRQMPW